MQRRVQISPGRHGASPSHHRMHVTQASGSAWIEQLPGRYSRMAELSPDLRHL